MPDTVTPGPVFDLSAVQEATCVHTRKIYDSCQSRDCMEDLRLYPTVASQAIIEQATTIKPGQATLLYTLVTVEPLGLNQGFYTIDLRYYYKVTGDAYVGAIRPVTVTGLAVFDKRSVLFGSRGNAKVFTSEVTYSDLSEADMELEDELPTAVLEAVDPILLSMKIYNVCDRRTEVETPVSELPEAIVAAFDEPISLDSDTLRRVYVTLGQFSLLRLERDTQLLLPIYDYCMPEKSCDCDTCDADPCDLFQQVDFPVGQFFPPSTADDLDPVSQFRRANG